MMLLGHHVNSSYVYDLLIIMLSNAGILICCSYYIYKFKVLASASLFEEITFCYQTCIRLGLRLYKIDV